MLIILSGLFLSVNTFVEWLYHLRFIHRVLPHYPEAQFKDYYEGEYNVGFDRAFVNFGLALLSLILIGILRTQENFEKWKRQCKVIPKYLLVRTFYSRLLLYIFLMVPVIVFIVVIGDAIDSSNDIIMYGMMFFLINSMALFPYLALKDLAAVFKFKDVILFNVGMAVVLFICIKLGVKSYAAAAIAGPVAGLPFVRKMHTNFDQLAEFFDMKNKNLSEAMSSEPFELYQQSSSTSMPHTVSDIPDELVYLVPERRSRQLLMPVGAALAIFSFFLYQYLSSGTIKFGVELLFAGLPWALLLYCFIKIIINRNKTTLLRANDKEITVIKIDYRAFNLLKVAFRLYINPAYKTFGYADIEKISVVDNRVTGPVVTFHMNQQTEWGLLFYYDDNITPGVLCEQLNLKRSAYFRKKINFWE